MTKLSHRILATLDRIAPWYWFTPKQKCYFVTEPRAAFYRTFWGEFNAPRFCIIEADGRVQTVGDSWEVYHLYDADGKFIARGNCWELCKRTHGDKLVFGDENVQTAWKNQPGYANRGTGGLAL